MHTCVHECSVRFSQEVGNFAGSCKTFPYKVRESIYKPLQEVAMIFSTSGENEIGRAEILALLNILKQFKRLSVRQADSQK